MTDEEHKQRHIELHRAIDELFADFILNHPHEHAFTEMPIIRLLRWSHEQTEYPTNPQP